MKRLIGIDDFVERLRSVEGGLITRDKVLELCDGVQVSDASLAPYTYFDDTFYTRNLIYRDDLLEVMAICWQPGQRTAVHTHNGQLCWMVTQRGHIKVVDYKWLGCDHPENQNVVGIDCLAGSDHIELERVREVEACAGGPVVTADKLQTIHQLFNAGEPTISLHVYSRPIDSCVAFDMQNRHCYRRELSYYSRHGERVPRRQLPVVGAGGPGSEASSAAK
jgi:cysteine dioxygenase